MKITITPAYDGFTRTISVSVDADSGKQIQEVETIYDNFTLGHGHDLQNPPVSTYSRTFTQEEGITPNEPHTVRVNARHTDGTSDSGVKTWND